MRVLGLVVAVWVEGELADEFAGGGVDDGDVEVLDQQEHGLAVPGAADADVVQAGGKAVRIRSGSLIWEEPVCSHQVPSLRVRIDIVSPIEACRREKNNLSTSERGVSLMTTSGGADASGGFRYQHLVTVEALLDAFEADPNGAWLVGVDVRGKDSADFIILPSFGAAPEVAVQVKSSLATSSTRLTRPDVTGILSAMHREYPAAARFEIRTNRQLTGPAAEVASVLGTEAAIEGLTAKAVKGSRVRAEVAETVETVAQRLRSRIATYRAGIQAEVAGNITQLLISRLRDLVDEMATATKDQYINASMIAEILRLPGQELAQASGGRQYGRLLGLPVGEVIRRDRLDRFLDSELSGPYEGVPRVAVVVGPPGSGKSSAVSGWVKGCSERFFCVAWLAADSEELLQAQVPALLEQVGETFDPTMSASRALGDVLRKIPFPWLLVLDGASSMQTVAGWIPKSGYGDVVITSQDSTWPASHARVLPIGDLTDKEAGALVQSRLGSRNSGEPMPSVSEKITQLAEAMAYWPLAIDMACHWIARRGGRLDSLEAYLARVSEIDLDESQSVPSGYTGTAVAAILLTWKELSDHARAMLTMGLLCGGDDVPLDAIEQAYGALPDELRVVDPNQESVLEELMSSSLVTRFLKDSRDPDAPGRDRIAIHQSLRLIGEGRLEYPAEYLVVLSSALDGRSRLLRDEARIQEAASYLPAGLGVLRVVAELFETKQQLLFAPAMHNVGDLLLLTGVAEDAAFWLNQAASVYAARILDAKDPHPGMMEYFLGSAGRLTAALLQTQLVEQTHQVVESVVYLVELHPDMVSGVAPQAALELMSGVLRDFGSDRTDLQDRLRRLQANSHFDERAFPETAFVGWWMRLAEASDTALVLVQQERWGDALDSFLIAASTARDQGAMQYDVVETGIRIGVALLSSLQKRLLAQPPARWQAAWDRFLEWQRGLEDPATHQQARLKILTGVVEKDPPSHELRNALQIVEAHSGQPLAYEEVSMWRALLKDVERRHAWSVPWEIFSDELLAGANVELIRTHDGGSDVMVWLFVSGIGLPGVAFANISATVNSGKGWEDPLPAALQRAGFPRHDPSRQAPAIPQGWNATLQRNELTVTDSDGTPWLTTDLLEFDVPIEWRAQLRRSKHLHVIYGDVGDTLGKDLQEFPYQAAVRLRTKWVWSLIYTWGPNYRRRRSR